MTAETSLDRFAAAKLKALEQRNLKRTLVVTEQIGPIEVIRDGKRLISFSSNDYLNLSQHPKIKEAAVRATERYGTGSGASRLVTGNHPLFAELEERLARLKGTESAIVFGSGYLTNTGVIPALISADDAVFVDELAHSCIHAGANLTRGALHVFRHNDTDHLRNLLDAHRLDHPHALIVTDGVFSMDGDLAPIRNLVEMADAFDAWLLTDDAHGIGVVGNGRGSAHANGSGSAPLLQMGTLSKAIGSYGGYLCASRPVINLIASRCRTFIYSTGLPPGSVAAAIAALDLIESNPNYAAQPLKKARSFAEILGLPPGDSPIVPVILGETEPTLSAARLLEDEGYLVIPIRPPTVPEGTARLRITFTAEHNDADIDRLADILRERILKEEPLSPPSL